VIDLREGLRHQKHPGLFPVPAAGLLQLVLCNPEKTGVKVFAIKYDFRTMPANTHTFLRQRTHVSSAAGTRGALRYAAHVRFVSSKRGQLYLYQDIRLIFAHRAPDVTEHQLTTTEGPSDPVFTPCDALTARASPSKRGSDEELNDSGIRTSPEVVPIPMAPLESAWLFLAATDLISLPSWQLLFFVTMDVPSTAPWCLQKFSFLLHFVLELFLVSAVCSSLLPRLCSSLL
jgi:hypothetical protein